VGLDPQQVFTVRDASVDLEDIHISLNEGTVALVRAVDGHVTGATFSGDGQILMIPPAGEERQAMALFTSTAVLNERFSLAYLRFDDETIAAKLQNAARPAVPPPSGFIDQYGPLAKNLAPLDALSLAANLTAENGRASYFHARIVGQRLGTFDVLLDTTQPEQIVVAQVKRTEEPRPTIDVWSAFCTRSMRDESGGCKPQPDAIEFSSYKIDTVITPPHAISSVAEVNLKALTSGDRVLLFNLGRSLRVDGVELEGKPLPVLSPQEVTGERTSEFFGVVMPTSLREGQQFTLAFRYSGPVLADAGGGLVYIDDRGKWYPSRGLALVDFDMTFRYPAGWQLLATGNKVERKTEGSIEFSHWKTQRKIPLAGFNLGHFTEVDLAGKGALPQILSYASKGVEAALLGRPAVATPMEVTPLPGWHRQPPRRLNLSPAPPAGELDPSKNAAAVAEQAARTIEFLEPRVGKFPYPTLHITQMPGRDSQGFPQLIYLSSYVFLNPEQRWRGRVPGADSVTEILYNRVMAAHETAHQWWGDAVFWDSYREQWLCEALANYLALMQLEAESPEYFATMLDNYRTELIEPQKPSGLKLKDAGAVSLGLRLNSSKYPRAYDAVAYGRGTWLIHMLREMYRDAAAHPSSAVRGKRASRQATATPGDPDAAFFAVLRKLQQEFAGRPMVTRDVKKAFEEALQPGLLYEGKRSLDWFFDGWVNGTAVPQIELKNVKFLKSKTQRTVSFAIKQSACPDSLVTSLPLYVERKNGSTEFLKRVFADGPETEFRFEVPPDASQLLLDPYRTVLRM
jgi:hypothetical protein